MSTYQKEKYRKPSMLRDALLELLKIVSEYKKLLVGPVLGALIFELFSMGGNLFIAEILSGVEANDNIVLAALLGGIVLYDLFSLYIEVIWVRNLIRNISYKLYAAFTLKVLKHVTSLGHNFFSTFPISKTQDRLNKVWNVIDVIEQGIWHLLTNAFQVSLSLIVYILYKPIIIPFVGVSFLLFVICNNLMIARQTPARERRKDRSEDSAELMLRTISGNTTLVLNSALNRTLERLERSYSCSERVGMLEAEHFLTGVGIFRDIAYILGRRAVLALIVLAAFSGDMGIPRMVLIFTVTERMFIGLWGLNRFIRLFIYESATVIRISELLNLKPCVEEIENPKEIPAGSLSYEFSDVGFTYPTLQFKDEEKEALPRSAISAANRVRQLLGLPSVEDALVNQKERNGHLESLNFLIEAGEKVGVVGTSGAGKSTLSLLLTLMYLPEEGNIKVNGQDLSEISGQELRERIAVVQQGTNIDIFSATLRENITLGQEYSDEELIKALKVANFLDVMIENQWPLMTEEIIGEKGRTLSGGQQQRVAIARAVIRNPDLIILDEATSSLDTETEKAVQESLDSLLEGRTAVIIAHRLSTLRSVDKIIVLDKGTIVEAGAWEELVEIPKGVFRNLVELQAV